MKSALGFDIRVGVPGRVPFAPIGGRYSIVGKLRSTGRAEVYVGLPITARRAEELVVIKAYAAQSLEAVRVDDGSEVPAEIDVASTPRHDSLARVFECGREAGKYFVVSEYLEGVTLRRLLRWLAGRSEKLPDAAVTRVLLGLFAAVEHANHWARTPQARALVHQPIDAADVFITYAGAIKVLGFKPPRARNAAALGDPPIEPAAVDALLSTQCSPALAAVLARIGRRVSTASLIGLWQVARVLKDWQSSELHSDGLAELADVMAGVQRDGRAARRKQLDAAVARVLRARDAGDAAPVSGYRVASSVVRPDSMRRDAGKPTVLVHGSGVISHLQSQQGSQLQPVSQQPVSYLQPVSHLQRVLPPPFPSTESSSSALSSRLVAAFASSRPAMSKPRHRSTPWPSLVMLAAALAAGFAVARQHGARVESPAPLQAPIKTAETAPAPVVAAGTPAPAPVAAAGAQPPAPVVVAAARAPAAVAAAATSVPAEPSAATPPPSLGVAAAAPALAAAAPAPSQPSLAPVNHPPRSNPQASRVGSAPSARAAAAPGYLTLDTTPWSAVSVGGKQLGQTPLVKVELPPGQHLLELANRELSITTSILIEISSGATTVRRIGLERPARAARQ